MHKLKTMTIAIYAGITALVIGVIAFTLGWNFWEFWGGPLPGYQIFLYPGNLTLIYVWHPLFTEEVNFWPKLVLLLFGQFFVVTFVVALFTSTVRKLRRVLAL